MADSPPTTNVTSRMSIDSTSVFDPFKSQSSFDSPQGATKTPSLSTNPSATNPSIANLPVAAQPGKPLSSGAKAGIAIGVLILVLSCVLVGYIWHRRRRTPQRESRREEDIQQKQPLEIHGAPISEPEIPWYDQPKDDEAMIRLFREVDGRLTDHVLNFYVLSDVEMYDEDVSTPPREIRRDLESKVSRLGQLLPLQASRAFVLRAIISERIMRSACGQAQVPVARAPKRSVSSVSRRGVETVTGSSRDERLFHDHDFRERWVLRLAQAACDEVKAFAVTDPKSELRLRSMEGVVRTAVEFVITMAKQPTRFELIWPPRGPGESLSRVPYDPQTMEAENVARRDGHYGSAKVRAAAFPGLKKWQGEEGSLLSKIQVLLY